MTPALQSKLLRFLEEKTFKRVGGLDRRARRRAGRRGDQPRSRGGGEGRQVPRGPLLSSAGHADSAAAAARAARRHPAARRTSYIDRFNRRVPEARARPVAGGDRRCSSSTSGPATFASCGTPSSAPCCSIDRERLEPGDFHDADTHRSRRRSSSCRPRASTSRRSSGSCSSQALERVNGNQTQAAQLLGINRDQVRYRIEKFGLARTHS